jgi:hypothetical protein
MMMMMKLMKFSGIPAHAHQNKNPNKPVRFTKSTKPPKPIPHETPDLDFTLGMTITFKSGTGMSEHVVYKGATSNGFALSPLINLETQHNRRSARIWMKKV